MASFLVSGQTVVIIGTGLVGSSLGMALQRVGVEVWLQDVNPSHALVAAGLGAGQVGEIPVARVQVVVVATPPESIGKVVTQALVDYPDAVVTDVGSVKTPILSEVAGELARYVPSHPMAGSQFTGPLTADGALFEGRTWAITPTAANPTAAVAKVRWLAESVGARVMELPPEEHDVAVAQVSHVPHLMSILTAGHLRAVPSHRLQLAGQGIRDVTRIANSDPNLWRQILVANKQAVASELRRLATDLGDLIEALDDPNELESLLQRGRVGATALRGKHGQDPLDLVGVTVEIPDEPRALARLFGEIGELGFNVEDFELTHDTIREVGYLNISVERNIAEQLHLDLLARGWQAWSNTPKEQA